VRPGLSEPWLHTLSAAQWLNIVRDVCAQDVIDREEVCEAMSLLADVATEELRSESRLDKALDSINTLLACGASDGSADDVHLLFAASKAVPRHSRLWAHALRTNALVPSISALLDRCACEDSTYRDKVLVSQMAILQPRLYCTCNTFWQRLATDGMQALDARQAANTLYAYAKLNSQVKGAAMPTECVADILQDGSKLTVPFAHSLHDAFLAGIERTVQGMSAQNVANTLWALASLDMPPADRLRVELMAAAMRFLPTMKPQEVANTAWALATLVMLPVSSLRSALLAAVERSAPRMNAQEVANVLWAESVFVACGSCSSNDVPFSLFERAVDVSRPITQSETLSNQVCVQRSISLACMCAPT
jgi:hypothetical protein